MYHNSRSYFVIIKFHSHPTKPNLLLLVKSNDDPEKDGDTKYLFCHNSLEALKLSLGQAKEIIDEIYSDHEQKLTRAYYQFEGYKISVSYINELDLNYDLKYKKQLSYTKNIFSQIH